MNWKGKVFVKIKTKENETAYEDIFDTYGVCLLKGSYENLLEYPSPKSFITWSDRSVDGAKYLIDEDTIRIDKKEVTINILLTAESEQGYYDRFEKFFKTLTSGIVFMKIYSLNKVFKLVYSKMSGLKKINKKTSTFALSFVEPNPNDRN